MFNDLEVKYDTTGKKLFESSEKIVNAFFDEFNHLIINFSENAGLDTTLLGNINHNHYYKISKDKIKLLHLLSNNTNEIQTDENTFFKLLEEILKKENIRNNFKEFLTENKISFELTYKRY